MRRIGITLAATALLLLGAAPPAAGTVTATSADLMQFAPPIAGAEGTVTVTRRANGSFSWGLTATGLAPGHAYTVWVGNFARGADPNEDGGHGAGGLVGGSGAITAAGNHCVRPLEVGGGGFSGGFEPGTAPDCGFVDASLPFVLFLIDHGPWEPGNQSAFRTPIGGGFVGAMFAVLP